MSQLVLIAGIGLLVAALAVGLPAWRSWQAHIATDRNAERYVAWRGRGDRSAPAARTPLTAAEQRRLVGAAGLAALGLAGILIALSGG